MTIHIIQCLCPLRHCITATMFDEGNITPQEALAGFQGLMEMAVKVGAINRHCTICGKDVEFHYEDGITKFQTMDEARAAGKFYESVQLNLRRYFDAGRN